MDPVLVGAALSAASSALAVTLRAIMVHAHVRRDVHIARIAHDSLNDRIRLLPPGSTLEESCGAHRVTVSVNSTVGGDAHRG
ncbi:hypothetical protein SABIM44S_00314 [Streptomyces abikoensis]